MNSVQGEETVYCLLFFGEGGEYIAMGCFAFLLMNARAVSGLIALLLLLRNRL